MNGPEGFLPKKLNSMMQVVQVMWFRPNNISRMLHEYVCRHLFYYRYLFTESTGLAATDSPLYKKAEDPWYDGIKLEPIDLR